MGELISLLNVTIQLLVGIGLFIVLIRIGRLIEKVESSFDDRREEGKFKCTQQNDFRTQILKHKKCVQAVRFFTVKEFTDVKTTK